MVIKKGKMVIKLEDDVNKVNLQIEELLKVKQMLIDSSAYKLLYGKTQTIGDKEQSAKRARLQHSQNISKIAQNIIVEIYEKCATDEQKETMIFEANKVREMLYVDICSLAHDLGHTPYGHNGERSINKFIQNIKDNKQIEQIIKRRIECFGIEYEEAQGHIGEDVVLSFEHNEQSALTFYNLLKNSNINLELIDLPRIINAILSHSTTRVTKCPKDIVAQIVRQTDKIEYITMDYYELKDYIKPIKDITIGENLQDVQKAIVQEAIEKGKINDDMNVMKGLRKFRKKYEETIFFLDEGKKGLLTSENIERNRVIISKLLEYYYQNTSKIYDKTIYRIKPINSNVEGNIRAVYNSMLDVSLTRLERTINYILSMDNMRAEREYLRLVKQRILTGNGIEPVMEEELQLIRKEQENEKVEQLIAQEYGKTAQPHTIQEMRNIVKRNDDKFMEKQLTEEGYRVIEETKEMIEREKRIDRILYEQMDFADIARKHESERGKAEPGVIDKIIGERNISESERIESAKMNAKNNWEYKEGISRNRETEEYEK